MDITAEIWGKRKQKHRPAKNSRDELPFSSAFVNAVAKPMLCPKFQCMSRTMPKL